MSLFEISDDTMVITSDYVLYQEMPVLQVTHEDDEEAGSLWQFHCGNGDYSSKHMKLVRLDTMLRLDLSLLTISHLPVGMMATRPDIDSDWTIEPLPPEDEGEL